MTATETDHIQSVTRAFRIIKTLEENQGMTMSELSDEFDIPRSTAHVYLKTLSDTEYIIREGNKYKLGLRFLKHGGYVRYQLPIYQAAKSEVDALARRTGEAVDLGIEENGKRVLVYKSEGPDVVTQKPVTGDYAHMHMTALGKAMLSTFDKEDVNEIISEHDLPKATQHTIDNQADLYADLDQIRERGYSLEDQERREGIRAVGVPIDLDHDIVSALSISGPMSKLTESRIDELQQQIHASINVIEIKMRKY